MADNWVMIYSSPKLYEIEMVKDLLSEYEIECVEMNKRDSAYLIGEYEIYVKAGQAFEATQIISRFKSE